MCIRDRSNPGAITITDSFSTFFHVSIEFPEDVDATEAQQICKNSCLTIHETILTGIRKASQRLNYNNSIPSIAFPCSKHEATDLHPAIISTSGLLTCTAQPASVCNKLTESHKLWLGKNMLSDSASKGKCTVDTIVIVFFAY